MKANKPLPAEMLADLRRQVAQRRAHLEVIGGEWRPGCGGRMYRHLQVRCRNDGNVAWWYARNLLDDRDDGPRCTSCSRKRVGRDDEAHLERLAKARPNLEALELQVRPTKKGRPQRYVRVRCRSDGYERWAYLQGLCWSSGGTGCPACADSSFKPNEPASVYLIEVTHPALPPHLKLGITRHANPLRRYRSDRQQGTRLRLLARRAYARGADARALEVRLQAAHAAQRYTGASAFLHTGVTECYAADARAALLAALG